MSRSLLYTIFFFFCLVGLIFFFSGNNGLIVKMRIIKNEREYRNIYYLQKERFKVVTENRSLIFSEGEVSLLNTRNKTYWKGSIKTFNKAMLNSSLNPYIQLKTKNNYFKKSLQEKDRKALQKIVESTSGKQNSDVLKAEIKMTPDYNSIAGFVSRKYLVKQNNRVVEEIWVAENLKKYIHYDLNLDLYNDFMESLLQHTDSRLYLHLESFMGIIKNGFPMRIRMYGGKHVTETEVEQLIKKKFHNSVFELGKGYKRVELSSLLN
ncbi:DUF4412 domain-containing protein [Marinifilum sp.]|uniref:DUF4412 domain-containing protein n=1 Tax=Marinifilum sp. TaxID=2033137 RepID=UPI003BAAB041